MSWNKNDLIPEKEIKEKVTNETVLFATRFGEFLSTNDSKVDPRTGRVKI